MKQENLKNTFLYKIEKINEESLKITRYDSEIHFQQENTLMAEYPSDKIRYSEHYVNYDNNKRIVNSEYDNTFSKNINQTITDGVQSWVFGEENFNTVIFFDARFKNGVFTGKYPEKQIIITVLLFFIIITLFIIAFLVIPF